MTSLRTGRDRSGAACQHTAHENLVRMTRVGMRGFKNVGVSYIVSETLEPSIAIALGTKHKQGTFHQAKVDELQLLVFWVEGACCAAPQMRQWTCIRLLGTWRSCPASASIHDLHKTMPLFVPSSFSYSSTWSVKHFAASSHHFW